jgi:transposase
MEHTRFVGLDIHKERISIAVAESGRSGAVEYLGEISNDPVAIGKLNPRTIAYRMTGHLQAPQS